MSNDHASPSLVVPETSLADAGLLSASTVAVAAAIAAVEGAILKTRHELQIVHGSARGAALRHDWLVVVGGSYACG